MGRKPRWSWLRVYTGESLTRPLGLSRPCPFPGPQGTFVLTHFVLVQGTGPGIFDVLLTQILYQHWHTWFSPQHLGILFSQSLKGMLCRPLDGSHACLYPGPLSRKCKDSHNSSHYFRTPLSNEATGNSPHPHHLWNDELCRNFFQWQKMPVLSGQYKALWSPQKHQRPTPICYRVPENAAYLFWCHPAGAQVRGYLSREKFWVQLEALLELWMAQVAEVVVAVMAVGDEEAAVPFELGFYCSPRLWNEIWTLIGGAKTVLKSVQGTKYSQVSAQPCALYFYFIFF